MPSTHLIDPELRPLLNVVELFRYDDASLTATRGHLLAMLAAAPTSLPDGVEKRELFVDGPAGAPPVRVLVYRSSKHRGERPALLNIHGGGYVAGAPEMQEAENARLADELGLVVVSPDYRLAPETRFPGAIEDCYAVLGWMVSEARQLNIDPRRIAASGESAGGGLAAALAVLARDRKDITLAFQRLIYPMLDDRPSPTGTASLFVGQFVWTRDGNAFGWSCLLGDGAGGPEVSPYAAAARAENLAGLPPTFIACGALDFLLHENLRYGERLLAAGIPTEMHVYPNAPHGFTLLTSAAVSQRYTADADGALRRGLNI